MIGRPRPILSPEDEAMVQSVRQMIADGKIADAMAAVERMSSRPQLRVVGRRLIAAATHAMRLGFAPREKIEDAVSTMLADMHREDRQIPASANGPLIKEKPGAEAVVIAFAGGDEAPFAHIVLQSYLRARPCHVVYVSGQSYLFGVGGLPGLGGDFPTSVRGLRAIADRLGAARRYCLGFSGNGYAALRHAIALEADGVLAFSPPTRLDADPEDPDLHQMIRDFHRHRPGMAEDLLPIFQQAPRLPRATIVYGGANKTDTEAALRMAELPNLKTIGIPGYLGHDTLAMAIVSRKLAALLDGLLAGRAVDRGPVPSVAPPG